ncbi:hypothetical protein Aperf_G00000121718 [Anoplocephala perfoliata]
MVCFVDPNSVEVGSEEWELVIGSLVASPDGEVEGSETPSIVNVTAESSTSVKVFIRKPEDTTGIVKYTASIKGNESESCDMEEEEGEEELSCEISNLSPGRQYTVKACSWLEDEASSHNCNPEEKIVWTKPLAPSIVNVTAESSTSVKVFIRKPEDTTGIVKYTASIKGNESESCDMEEEEGEEELSCEISNLSPGRQYTVKACSWLEDEASSHNCNPEEKIVWTKPLAPSIVNVTAESSTSVKVFIRKPEDTTGIVKYTASIKGNESESCDMEEEEGEEELSCEISNLSPGRQYTVKACSWLEDEASSHNCNPEEKIVWTKPLAPSIVNVTAESSTSVKVFIRKPEDTTGIVKYTASIKGNESESCDMEEEEGEEELSCEISNLSPGRQYTVKACSWLEDEASSHNCNPEEKIVWTKPLAPSIVNVTAESSTSVKVFIRKPEDTTGIVKYTASIKGNESESCDMEEEEGEEELSCEISNLSPGRQYTVKACSWLEDEASSHNCNPEEKIVWTKPLAPSIVNVTAESSTSVKVFIRKPEDTTGIVKYTASIKGNESESCDMEEEEGEEELSCEISNLSPGRQYTVKACSWLEDEASSHNCNPEEKIVWTKPLAPSIVNVTAESSTSVKVFIRKPEDTTGIVKYTASIKGNESESCDMEEEEGEEELSCEISNLSPGRQYTVKACSWLEDEASSHNCNPEEKIVWTKPLAPSIVNVTAESSTSVKVFIRKPEDTTGIVKYTASIKGNESESCDMEEEEGEEELSCEISNLSPGRQYTVKACSWLEDEASSHNCNPEEKIVWTKPLAPSIVNVTAESSTSVKVFIRKPEDTTGIVKYTASIKGNESESCDMEEEEGEEELSCEISNLSPGRQYTVKACSWLEDEASSHNCNPEEKIVWTKPLAPSIVNVTAESSTSVKVFIRKPEDTTGIVKYTASIKGNESESCDMEEEEGEEELSCEISNLSPGRQYTVKACSWLEDEASSHNCNPEEKIMVCFVDPSSVEVGCEEWELVIGSLVAGPDGEVEGSETPSIVNVTAESSTSVKVFIRKPEDTTGIVKYTASIKGNESESCDMEEEEGEEELSCEISNLSPGRQYTVKACSWLEDEASSHNCNPEEKIVWTKPLELSKQPSSGEVGTSSVEVIWSKVAGVDGYQARAVKSADGVSASTCETNAQASSCTIEDLKPSTNYSVNTDAVDAQSSGSALKIEQFEPPELSYLSQIPQPIPFAEFSGRLQALNDPAVSAGLFQSFDDKQTMETFENECRLTRRTAEQFRDRNRYGNSMQCVTTECRAEPQKFGAPEGTDERFADPCELLISGLLK